MSKHAERFAGRITRPLLVAGTVMIGIFGATGAIACQSTSTTTTLTYGDTNWPERPTLITVDSLRPGQSKKETFIYDAVTGAVTAHTVSGP